MNQTVNTYVSLALIGAISAFALTVVQAQTVDAVTRGISTVTAVGDLTPGN